MIFESLGIMELGIVLILILVLVDPKEVGKFMRWFGKLQRQLGQVRQDIRHQFDTLLEEDEAKKGSDKTRQGKSVQRKWARDQLAQLSGQARSEGSLRLTDKFTQWSIYREAKVVSCFAGGLNEVDTSVLLRRILADGKTLLMPYCMGQETLSIGMAKIADLENDLEEGRFGLLEPMEALRNQTHPEPDLILVPGLAFDLTGGRLGRGKGLYDRYLATRTALRCGLCFDEQIHPKKLALEPHDQVMDYVVTDRRLVEPAVARREG